MGRGTWWRRLLRLKSCLSRWRRRSEMDRHLFLDYIERYWGGLLIVPFYILIIILFNVMNDVPGTILVPISFISLFIYSWYFMADLYQFDSTTILRSLPVTRETFSRTLWCEAVLVPVVVGCIVFSLGYGMLGLISPEKAGAWEEFFPFSSNITHFMQWSVSYINTLWIVVIPRVFSAGRHEDVPEVPARGILYRLFVFLPFSIGFMASQLYCKSNDRPCFLCDGLWIVSSLIQAIRFHDRNRICKSPRSAGPSYRVEGSVNQLVGRDTSESVFFFFHVLVCINHGAGSYIFGFRILE